MILDDLGPRICVMGPSNSGKSTLATAIGRARSLTPIHLDLLFHLPNTDWQPRTDEEFIALHDEALSGASWVIDGNYSTCLPQRLARATRISPPRIRRCGCRAHIRSAPVLGCSSFLPPDSFDAIVPVRYPHFNGRRQTKIGFLMAYSQLNSRSLVLNFFSKNR